MSRLVITKMICSVRINVLPLFHIVDYQLVHVISKRAHAAKNDAGALCRIGFALAGVAQRGGQTVHRQLDPDADLMGIIALAEAPQQLHLQQVQRNQVREAITHRVC